MKWVYRLFTFGILGVAIGLPFFIDNQQGEPMLSIPSVSDVMPQKAVNMAAETTVYKWQDAQGGWHYGDAPPPEAIEVSTITVNPNANLIQSIPPEKEVVADPGIVSSPMQKPLQNGNQDLLSIDRAMNILNETKQVANMMESRNSQLNAIVGENSKQ